MNIFTAIGQFYSNWGAKLASTFLEDDRYMMLVDGLRNTAIITLGALCIGIVIGALVAIIKYCGEGNPAMKPLCVLCDIYTTVIRGIPVVVLLLIFYFVIMKSASGVSGGIEKFCGIGMPALFVMLLICIIRACTLPGAVDAGQMEAGRSLGMSRIQTTIHVILPQAMKNILPAIGNEMIALLKETAVAGYVAVQDLTRAGNLIRNNTFDAFNPLMVVALTYLIIVVALTWLLGRFEKRLHKGDRH